MGSKYQGQRGPTPSRYYLNFERADRATERPIPPRLALGRAQSPHGLRRPAAPTYDPTNVMGRRIGAWFIDVFVPR